MKPFWQELQPVDSFIVKSNGLLYEDDRKIIDLLYQPLIGPISTSLYHTLWNMLKRNRLWSDEWNHYYLMIHFDLNLKEIFHARLKLEGIGLLKTFVKVEQSMRKYVYELQPPLTAEQFFSDGMLNIYLYQKLGSVHFNKLKRFFIEEKLDVSEYHDMTRSFQDVFRSAPIHPLEGEEGKLASEIAYDEEFIQKEEASPIQVDEYEFDFELLLAGLSEELVPRRSFTKPVREAIQKLAFLYSIDAIAMKNIVLSSLTPTQEINIEELRKAARDWYQMEHGNTLPQLVDRKQPILHRTVITEPKTEEEKLIHYLESVSPRQFLIDLADGSEPAISDLQLIEDIMFQQKLLPGVVNVLIHYVLLRSDMKLTRSYVTKIASHWARKKIKTVKEAMELAKNEHRQYQEWAKEKTAKMTSRRKPIRQETLPDWFTEPEEEEIVVFSEEQEAKRRRLEALQQKLREGGGEKGGTN